MNFSLTYLHKFLTKSAHDAAYDRESDEYVEPWLAYTVETEEVSYNLPYEPVHDYSQDYLTVVAYEPCTVNLSASHFADTLMDSISYSTDGGESWTETAFTSIGINVSFNLGTGETALIKGQGDACYNPDSNIEDGLVIGANGEFGVYGNIMSLLYGDDFVGETGLSLSHTFAYLFLDSTNLVNCENLILPSTTLVSGCYRSMFQGCTSLVTAPALPATTLANDCYQYMFNGCTSLTTAPAILPATTLQNYCYQHMFRGCTSLTTAPVLPATTLADGCYYSMFSGTNVLPDCTNIDFTSQTVVASGGLRGLFADTKVTYNDLLDILPINLSTNKCYLPVTTLTQNCYDNMFSGCTALVNAPELPATTLANSCYRYMFNGCTSLTTAPATLPATTLQPYCYQYMFSGCTSLTTAPATLPATDLSTASYCYDGMFYGCTSLTTAPALSATTLGNYCCQNMFNGCTSLTSAPVLPAMTLANWCYTGMFKSCSSLATAPALPATTLAQNCYRYMFYGCTSLTTAPATLPATTLQPYCYQYMFSGCTSLTTAPVLPATTLVNNCYSVMFYGCSNLNYIKAMFTTTPTMSYTSEWVNGVSSSGTFVKNSAASWTTTGVYAVPTGWTVQTASS